MPNRKRKKKGFMDEWLGSGRAPDPNSLSRNTVDHDRWDRQDVDRLRDEMDQFAAEADLFCDSVETGNTFWDDSFWSLHKVDPKLRDEGEVRPSHLVNRVVEEESMTLKEWEELRSLGTIGDDVAAAMGVITMRPDYEALFDKLEQEQELAKELDKIIGCFPGLEGEAADIDKMMEDLENSGQPVDGQGRGPVDMQKEKDRINQQLEDLRKQAKAVGQELKDKLDQKRPQIRAAARQAMGKAADEQAAAASSADAWGLEPGALQRLPHKERMELAQRLNNPKLRKIAELFGPMKRIMFTEQRRRVNHAFDEVYDLELGNDLDRVLPGEFAKLLHPQRKFEFYKDYAERRLPQYKMRGTEKVGRGPIIYCQDSSGSMGGDREMWAKAVALCLLHLARQQKRRFRNITFGSSYEIWESDFEKPEDFTVERIIEVAEFAFMGGTDFQTPLSRALDLLREEHSRSGQVKSDIVFATDGMCGVNDVWLNEFMSERERLAFNVYGISIGGHIEDEPLTTICNGKVATVADLQSGEDVRFIFGGIGGN